MFYVIRMDFTKMTPELGNTRRYEFKTIVVASLGVNIYIFRKFVQSWNVNFVKDGYMEMYC